MIHSLDELIRALREELQHYGEMLARLEDQQNHITRRAADDLLASLSCVNQQADAIVKARASREQLQHHLARELALPEPALFSQIIPLLPPDYRPLLVALVDENNQLLIRVRQRARQNHLLLVRSLELMQAFLGTLLPAGNTPVYNGAGAIFGSPLPAHSLYEAVG